MSRVEFIYCEADTGFLLHAPVACTRLLLWILVLEQISTEELASPDPDRNDYIFR